MYITHIHTWTLQISFKTHDSWLCVHGYLIDTCAIDYLNFSNVAEKIHILAFLVIYTWLLQNKGGATWYSRFCSKAGPFPVTVELIIKIYNTWWYYQILIINYFYVIILLFKFFIVWVILSHTDNILYYFIVYQYHSSNRLDLISKNDILTDNTKALTHLFCKRQCRFEIKKGA